MIFLKATIMKFFVIVYLLLVVKITNILPESYLDWKGEKHSSKF